MMSTFSLEELHQLVIGNPDADAPRNAYAAACEAMGDRDRAEFIRIQMETVARMRSGADGWWEFVHREMDLREANANIWAGPIHTRVARYEFFRGFVEEVAIDAKQFLADADELYRLAPIRRLTLTNVLPVIDELFDSPHLSRIVSLTMEEQKLGDREIETLARSPYLSRLAWLCLRVNDITVAGVGAMAASSGLPALRYVDFCANPADELVSEHVGNDQGQIVWIGHGLTAVEERYGRKTWLHPVEDHGMREVHEAEF